MFVRQAIIARTSSCSIALARWQPPQQQPQLPVASSDQLCLISIQPPVAANLAIPRVAFIDIEETSLALAADLGSCVALLVPILRQLEGSHSDAAARPWY